MAYVRRELALMHHQRVMSDEAIAQIVKSTPAEVKEGRDGAKAGCYRLLDITAKAGDSYR